MNITTPILNGAAQGAAMPGDSVASFLKMIGGGLGLFADDGQYGSLGLWMSGIPGVAAGHAVAIFLTIYFRTGYRSLRDMIKHGLAAAAVLGLLAFVAYDMRHAALAYLGINASNPAVEFEIRLPKAALSDVAGTQVELATDTNQTLVRVQGASAPDGDAHRDISGS